MSQISLKWFGGMIPRRGEQNLPPTNATEAENVNLYSGELRPLTKPALAHEFCRPEDQCWNAPLEDDPSFPPTLPECPPGGEPPVITQQPEDVSSIPGSPVTLTVVAEGTDPLIYQWYEDNIAIPGAVDPEYTYTPIQDEVRHFQVTIDGPCGRVASDVVEVNTSISNEPCEVFLSAVRGLRDIFGVWPHDEKASRSSCWDHSGNERYKITNGSFQEQATNPKSPMNDCRTGLVVRGTGSGTSRMELAAGTPGGQAAEAFRDAWTWGCWLRGSDFIGNPDSAQYFWTCSGHNLQDYGRIYWDSGDGRLRARKEGANDGATPVNAQVFTASSDLGFVDIFGAEADEWHHFMVVWGRSDGTNGLGGSVRFYKDFQLHKTVTDGRTSRSCLVPKRQVRMSVMGRYEGSDITNEPTCSMAYTMVLPRVISGSEIAFLKSEFERQNGPLGVNVNNFWVHGPDDYFVDVGEQITFDVNTPSVQGTPTYKWYTESGSLIPGETTDKLVLTASSSTEGGYYVVITDGQGFVRRSRMCFLKVNYDVPPTDEYTTFIKGWLEGRALAAQGLGAYWPLNDQPPLGGPLADVLEIPATSQFPLDGGTLTNVSTRGPLNETEFHCVDVRGQNSGNRKMWNQQANSVLFRNDMTFGAFVRRRNTDWSDGQNGDIYDTVFSCFPTSNDLTPGFDDVPTRNNELRFMVQFWNNSNDPDVDTDRGRVGMQSEIWEQVNEADPEDPPELHWRNTGLETRWSRVNSQDDEWHHVMVHFFSDADGGGLGRYKIWWDFQLVVDDNGVQTGLANSIPGDDWRVQLFGSENSDQFINEWDGRMCHAFIMQGFPAPNEVAALKQAFDDNNTVQSLNP